MKRPHSTSVSAPATPTRRDALLGLGATAAAIGFSRPGGAQETSEQVIQTAKFSLSEERIDEAVELLSRLVAAVEENEPGVLVYIAHRPVDSPNQVFFYEVYENEAALANHGQQPHLAKLRESFGTLFLPPVEIVRLDKLAGYSR